jgi:hypothetical protein
MLQKEDLIHQSDQPVLNSHKWPRTLTIILVYVLLLTMFALGGYWLGARQQQSLPTDLLTTPKPSWLPLATPDQQRSASPTTSQADPTAGWKIYTAPDSGFSIKFPNNWYYEENFDFRKSKATLDTLEVRVMFANFPPPLRVPDLGAGQCRFDILETETSKKPEQILGLDRYRSIGSLSSPTSETFIVVNKIKGIKRTYLADDKNLPQGTVVLLPGSSKLFALYFFKKESGVNDNCNHVFELMLRSFTISN